MPAAAAAAVALAVGREPCRVAEPTCCAQNALGVGVQAGLAAAMPPSAALAETNKIGGACLTRESGGVEFSSGAGSLALCASGEAELCAPPAKAAASVAIVI